MVRKLLTINMTLCYCTESTIHMCKCNHWLCSTRACLRSVGGKIAAHVYIVDGRTTPKYLLDRQRHSTKAYKRRNNYISLGLGRLNPPPTRRRSPLKLGRESVFLHCCFGHHAVVIEGYLLWYSAS